MNNTFSNNKALENALATLELESRTLNDISQKFHKNPKQLNIAIDKIIKTVDTGGHLIVIGMGKSGYIAQKISATFASTGVPSFYLHPAEALHGDLGRISRKDSILIISYSGKTQEVLALLPSIKRYANSLMVICGFPQSPLAKSADIFINSSVAKEACPHNLAPTSSTIVQLAIGDALAIGTLIAQNFSAKDFFQFHPGGSLGKKIITIRDIMHFDKELPIVKSEVVLAEALEEITRCKLGMTTVVDNQKKIVGVFTDGDLRRLIEKHTLNNPTMEFSLKTKIKKVMIKNPKTIDINSLAAEALSMMDKYRINQLLVTEKGKLKGAINMHDLLRNNIL